VTIDPTVVIAAISALSTGIGYIARRVYLDLKADRDFWRDTALTAIRHTDKAIDIATKQADGA
jgi:hypothetical protein